MNNMSISQAHESATGKVDEFDHIKNALLKPAHKTKKAGFYSGLFDTLYKRELKFFSAIPLRTTVNTPLR